MTVVKYIAPHHQSTDDSSCAISKNLCHIICNSSDFLYFINLRSFQYLVSSDSIITVVGLASFEILRIPEFLTFCPDWHYSPLAEFAVAVLTQISRTNSFSVYGHYTVSPHSSSSAISFAQPKRAIFFILLATRHKLLEMPDCAATY